MTTDAGNKAGRGSGPLDFLQMAAFNKDAGSALSQIGKTYADIYSEWQSEVMSFVDTRMKKDRDFQKSLSEGKDLSEAIKLQQHWLTAAMQDYLAETSKLMEIATHAAVSAWSTPLGASASKAEVSKGRPDRT